MISSELLTILCCPETRQRLSLVGDDVIHRVNAAIHERRLTNRAGQQLDRALDGGLLREDGSVLYPIFDGIPVLLRDDGIEMAEM
jgi:uncharacterized protein YbaR (Trm112 family)